MMQSSPTNKKQRPTTSYLVRPRLGPVRSTFSSKPMSSYTQDKKKKFKKSSSGKMDYRKKPDYADTAYREAVGRLRILLAESYTPIKRSMRELDSGGEDTDNQSLISATSRTSKNTTRPYYHYLSMIPKKYYYPSTRATTVVPLDTEKNVVKTPSFENNSAPPELMSFIEKQEDYIEQLEKESRFCREELGSLLSKVKDVISENENLHEKQKSNIMKSVFNHLETETETETEVDLAHKGTSVAVNFDSILKYMQDDDEKIYISLSPRKSKKSKTLEGPTIVFESRISELEAQLTQAKIDLKKALEDNNNYKKKIADGSILDGFGMDHYKKQIESLQREKDLLQETVNKLQSALSKIRDKENDTCDQVKRSLDVAEQAQYEKNVAEIEIRRLKDELDRQHSKLRDAIADQSRRISDERSAVERRYTQQIEQLTTELGVQWETTNKLQLELDKQRRENADLRREIAQKQALLDGMKKDMQSKIMSLQSDIGVNGAEKSALEQQISTLQMATDRNERQAKQEVTRLQAEMQSLRQRLDRADADLIHSRRENIRLGEQVASLEKEIKLNSAISEEKKDSSSGEILALPPPKEQDNKQLSSMIQDVESKHAATVAELEGMIHSQNQLMDKLSVECHTLTQKLEDASTRHKEEIRELQTSLNRLNSRLLNQSQITSSNVKDEDYNSISNQRTAQPQESIKKCDPINEAKNLSRTNSRSSVKPDYILSRKSSEEKASLPLSYQYSKQEPKAPEPKNEPTEQTADFLEQGIAETYESDQSYPPVANEATYDQQYIPTNDQNYIPQSGYDPETPGDNSELYSTDLNQYNTDPMHQYDTDPSQQYVESDQHYVPDPNQEYSTDPNQEYSTDPNQQYTMDPDQEQYMIDNNQQQYAANPTQFYPADPQALETSQQYGTEPSDAQYSDNPNDQYTDRPHQN